ncbi:MAG: DUF6785 family protein [Janthinobacterium lividum]
MPLKDKPVARHAAQTDLNAPLGLGTLPVPLPPRSVTPRALLLGLALMPFNAYWVIMMENIRYSAHPTTISLFFNCIFILVVLTGLNSLVARLRPKWAFCQGELLLVYAMLCIGSCMAAHDFIQMLVPNLTWPFARATPATGYAPLFGRFLPRWAMVSDTDATKAYYLGHSTLYTAQHLSAWLPAVLIWTAFVVVLLFTLQCVNVLIRQQWTDNERLSYPLVKIPLEITDAQPFGRGHSGVPLTHNRLFWAGFGLAFFVDLSCSLNYYFPAIPALGFGNGVSVLDLGQSVTSKPWSAIGWTPITLYPFVIGLGMLMPLEFLFSCWFFYLTWKLQGVLVFANAWDSDPRMPYANYQGFGAYFLFFASTLYLSRRYFRQVWQCATGRASELNDEAEPMRYKWALLGLGGGLLALVAFSVALGLAWWLAVLFFLIYLGLALAITRMRAELGTPVHDLHFTGPDWALSDLLGPRAIGAQSLGVFSLFYWFNRAYRAHPMPFQLEAFKMAEQTGAMQADAVQAGRREMRAWFWALLLAGGFGMVCAFWALLHTSYIYGLQWYDASGWDRYAGWLKGPKPPNGHVAAAIVVGFLFAAFLQAMRVRFFWWPFHPLAFAVSGSWEMNLLWMPLMIAWLFKVLLLRYGGIKAYTSALPFFYGLILGQFIPGSVLNLWGIITQNPTYQFWQ